ncbi:MAG: hypothetical protein ABI183_19895 [Polyangiaceae bacterium]
MRFPVICDTPVLALLVLGVVLGVVLGSSAIVGCSKSEASSVTVAESASALASSSAPVSAMVVKYKLQTDGKTAIDMPAPSEHIKAATSVTDGSLDVDLMNVTNTRGEVKADLTTLATGTFDDATKNSSQTDHARNWLEVGSLVTPQVKEANRWVVFAIRSIDGASATDITKVAPTQEGGEDIRTVTLTAHGEVLLHGHKSNKDATLEVKMHYPAGTPSDSKPTKIDIATKTPLHIVLAEHDIKPLDNFGKLATASLGLLGTKVANSADVTLSFTAVPQ